MSSDDLKAESSAGIKIVFFGSSLAGKTTALSIFHAIKNQTDPDAVYKFQKIEDKVTHRTIALDHAIFGLGNKKQLELRIKFSYGSKVRPITRNYE